MQLPVPQQHASQCKICQGRAELFDVVDFNKICSETLPYAFGLRGEPVYYFQCLDCGFIFTRHCDTWSNSDFAERIYNSDYNRVDGEYLDIRPRREASRLASTFPRIGQLLMLDFGSGNGALSRHLAKLGVSSVTNYDPFSSPLRPAGWFDVATAFEVFEHAPDPIATVRDVLSFMKDDCAILFTTLTQPKNICEVRGGHWYIAPRNGHISIYGDRSLAKLAKLFDLQFASDGKYHAFFRGIPPIRLNASPTFFVDLLAPLSTIAKGWSVIEDSHRWTSESSVNWDFTLPYDAKVVFTVPFHSEIRPAFASECYVFCSDRWATLEKARGLQKYELSATLDLPKGGHVVTLRTPEPLRPSDLHGSADKRRLGLFVRMDTD
ncbi:class I SAM-dependent methyltransferase [Bradyrhizobium sp. USDA 3650]